MGGTNFIIYNTSLVLMETGFDGEYYYVQLDEEDLDMLRELVLKKVRERSDPKYYMEA